jgi:sialic acid synthase SpsE
VAEIGGNHGGDPKLAALMVKAAKESAVTAVKFQAYRTHEFLHPQSPYFEELLAEELSFEQIYDLVKLAQKNGLMVATTIFDLEGIKLAQSCGADYLKISSGDLNNLPLIRKAASSGLKIVLSTGASSQSETKRAIAEAGGALLAVLQCTSLYPCSPEKINLAVLDFWLKKGLPAGLSDHSLGTDISLAALKIGAIMLEKHFTLSRDLKGGDNAMSLTPQEMSLLTKSLREIKIEPNTNFKSFKFWGSANKTVQEGEEPSLIRRAAMANKDLNKGEGLKAENLIFLRPPRPNLKTIGPDYLLKDLRLARSLAKGEMVELSALSPSSDKVKN